MGIVRENKKPKKPKRSNAPLKEPSTKSPEQNSEGRVSKKSLDSKLDLEASKGLPNTHRIGSLAIILSGVLFFCLVGVNTLLLVGYFDLAEEVQTLSHNRDDNKIRLEGLTTEVSGLKASNTKKDLNQSISSINLALKSFETDLLLLTELQKKQSTALISRLNSIEKMSNSQSSGPLEIKSYERDLVKLQNEIERQRVQLDKISEEMVSEVGEVKSKTELAKDIKNKSSQSVLARSSLNKINASVELGLGYQKDLEDLNNITDVSNFAAVWDNAEKGVVSLSFLKNGFPANARLALKVSRQEEGLSGGGSALFSFLKLQMGIRSLTPQKGNSADAILSRAQAAVSNGELRVALKEIGNLPEVGQIALQGWSTVAEARVRVIEELSEILKKTSMVD